MKNSTTIIIVLILIIILGFTLFSLHVPKATVTQITTTETPIPTVTYVCNESKTIMAVYYTGTSTSPVNPGPTPIPTGRVIITLSDGRVMTLPQSISADGNRYSSTDESFVFWNKGNGALVLENNQQKSYVGCIEVVTNTAGLPNIYQNGTDGYTLRYPQGYTVNSNYKYQALGPGKDVSGTKFTIPASSVTGTNLSSDSYISVEKIPNTSTCSAGLFLRDKTTSQTVMDSDTTYSLTSTSEAGAGNRYEEIVYAIPGTNPCVAIRYFIHYGNIENYPASTTKAFDKTSLIFLLDNIRHTLVLNQ